MSSRLAVDIGGTFTDVVLETGATSHSIKVLTTRPNAPCSRVSAPSSPRRNAGRRT